MDFRNQKHAEAVFDQQRNLGLSGDPSFNPQTMNQAFDAITNFKADFNLLDPSTWTGLRNISRPTDRVGNMSIDEIIADGTGTELDTMNMRLAGPDGVDQGPSFLDKGLDFVKDAAGGSPIGTGIRVSTDPDLPTSTRAVGAALPVLTSMMPGIGGTVVGGIGSIANAMGYHQDLNAPGTYGLGITSAGNLTGTSQDPGGGFVQSGDLNVGNALRDMQSNQYIDTPFGAQRAQTVAGLYEANEGANPFASEEDFIEAGGESNPYSAEEMAPRFNVDLSDFGADDLELGGTAETNYSLSNMQGNAFNTIAGAVYDAGGGYNDVRDAVIAAQESAASASLPSQADQMQPVVEMFSDDSITGPDTMDNADAWGWYNEGGYVEAAQDLASQGRGGDTMLMHMRPDEVASMAATGTVTQNPTTGLPENFLGGGIGAVLGPALGAALFPTIGPAGIALATGLGAGAGQTVEAMALGTQDPLRQGMMAGLTAGVGSYALSGLGSALGGSGEGAVTKFGNKVAGMQATKVPDRMLPQSLGSDVAPTSIGDVAFNTFGNVKDMPFAAPFALGAMGSSMAGAGAGDMDFVKTGTKDPMEPSKFERTARYAPTGDFREYGFGPQQQFFGAGQFFNEGGLAQGESMATQLTEQAISAIRGDHPEPKIAVSRYIEEFGEEAFSNLRGLVIQEDQMMEMAETDNGLLRGSDGGRDDLRRGKIDGKDDVRIASGEYIFSADDVALAGDGNTEAGARRLDLVRRNLRKKATGTEKRPDYVGEEGVEEVFEEVMTT